MNALLNYVLEANLGLVLFLLLYVLLLRNETDFTLKRAFMLMALVVSVVFPLLHFNRPGIVVPRLGDFVPPTWLPEVVVTAQGNVAHPTTNVVLSVWTIISWLYAAGVLVSLSLFVIRLSRLVMMMSRFPVLTTDRFLVVESKDNLSSFSFFRFIFIGQADQLTAEEKLQIIDHERIHASQLHSIDILLIQIYRVFFWFNPFLTHYQKIFVQLHEFEADARAVENRDVNNYCSLLAKVALLSADFKLANHFSNSLTLKRIEMMRTFKSKIRPWKIAVLVGLLPVFFFVVSCQDQVMNDAQEIAEKSTMALDIPQTVQDKIDELKNLRPEKKFVVMEIDQSDYSKAEDVKRKLAAYNPNDVVSVNVMKNQIDKHGNSRSFVILEVNEMTNQLSESTKQDGEIFTVVEEMATPPGGIDGLGKFLQENLSYPVEARQAGKEGTVFVQFVVNKDGSLTDFLIVKGVDPQLDKEALRVAQLFPNWTPGKQSGKVVRERFILPIRFKLDSNDSGNLNIEIREVKGAMKVQYAVTVINGEKVVKGTVLDDNGQPLRGANIVNVGTTSGTVTDNEGNFTIKVSNKAGQLAASFVGYEPKVMDY